VKRVFHPFFTDTAAYSPSALFLRTSYNDSRKPTLEQRMIKMKKWLAGICLAVTLLAGFSSVGSVSEVNTFAAKELPQRLPNQH
jgi:hypothetical protein